MNSRIEQGHIGTLGSTEVWVRSGNIVDASADLIIGSTDTGATVGGPGTVSHALNQATDGQFAEQLARHSPRKGLGEIVPSEPLGLSCQHLVSVVMLGTPEEEAARGGEIESRLRATSAGTRAALRFANDRGYHSLATPIFAVGLPVKHSEALQVIVAALRAELARPTSLERVEIMVYDAGILAPTRRFVAANLRNASLDLGDFTSPSPENLAEGFVNSTWGTSAIPALSPGLSLLAATPEENLSPLLRKAKKLIDHQEKQGPSNIALLRGAALTRFVLSASRHLIASRSDQDQIGSRSDQDQDQAKVHESSPELMATLTSRLRKLEAEQDDIRVKHANLLRECTTLQERVALYELDHESRTGLPTGAHFAQPAALAAAMATSELDPMAQRESLRKALSILLRYLSAIMLADYHQAGASDPAANLEIADILSRPVTDGGWLHLIHRIAQTQSRETTFFPEFPGLWLREDGQRNELLGRFDKLVKLRNEVHDLGPENRHRAQGWVDRALDQWKRILQLTHPVLCYPLFFVDAVDGFEGDSAHRYRVRWLTGNSVIHRSELIVLLPRLTEERLYLVGPDKQILPLAPFLAYAHYEEIGHNETFAMNQIQGQSISFVTFRFTHTQDLALSLPDWLQSAAGPDG